MRQTYAWILAAVILIGGGVYWYMGIESREAMLGESTDFFDRTLGSDAAPATSSTTMQATTSPEGGVMTH